MPDITPTQEQTQEIPYGYCQCGCGQKTAIAKVTRRKTGHVKGQSLRYLAGHQNNLRYLQVGPNPSGLCMCGCGQPTTIAKKSCKREGTIAGQPKRFLPNHHWSNAFPSPMERFWAKVDKRGPDECWLWTASHNGRGYGVINGEYAHRLSYELHIGPIPDGLFVCHHCDHPSCVNPAHLFVGTVSDNAADMVAKDRSPRGSRSGHTKLTESDVVKILELLDAGVQQKVIAAQFGISATIVGGIWRGQTWRHVTQNRRTKP